MPTRKVKSESLIFPFQKNLKELPEANLSNFPDTVKTVTKRSEELIQFIAVVLLSRCEHLNLEDESVRKAKRNLREPGFGKSAGLLRATIKVIYKYWPPDRELISFYKKKPGEATIEAFKRLQRWPGIDGAIQRTEASAMSWGDALNMIVAFRNHDAHRIEIGNTETDPSQPSRDLIEIFNFLFTQTFSITNLRSVIPVFDKEGDHPNNWLSLESTPQKLGLPHPELEEVNKNQHKWNLYVLFPGENGKQTPINLFPYCIAGSRDGGIEFGRITSANKVIISYEVSAISGSKPDRDFKKGNPWFELAQEKLKGIPLKDGHLGTPKFLLEAIKENDEDRKKLEQIVFHLEAHPNDTSNAIERLEKIIKRRPIYKDALQLLLTLYEKENEYEKSSLILQTYSKHLPQEKDVFEQTLKHTCKSGIKDLLEELLEGFSGAHDESVSSIKKRLKLDQVSSVFDQATHDESGEYFDTFYQAMESGLPWKLGHPIIKYLVVALLTVASVSVIAADGDILSAITTGIMGLIACVSMRTTTSIFKLLDKSYNNITSFLRIPGITSTEQRNKYKALIRSVFGVFPNHDSKFQSFKDSLVKNRLRFGIIVVLSILSATRVFDTAQLSAYSYLSAFSFGFIALILFLKLYYLGTVISLYQRLLVDLSREKMQTSFIQHPKLSIRYLSYLNRRISYPLLLIYFLISLFFFIGPFLANITGIGALTFFAFFVAYTYYKVFFLVRNILIENKWSIISRFSIHFQKPVDELIENAKKSDMNRVNELLEIRDFLDSIKVLPEPKRIIFTTTILYIGIIVASTSGLSHLMTRIVVPWIGDKIESYESESPKSQNYQIGTNPELEIDVSNVDDVFMVMSSHTLDAFTLPDTSEQEIQKYLKNKLNMESCHWATGTHGSMIPKLHLNEGKNYILCLAYNKIYHPPIPLLAGGKLSFRLDVSIDNQRIFRDSRFIRMNTKDLSYLVLLKMTREGYIVTVERTRGKENLPIELHPFVEQLETYLNNLDDAKVGTTIM